MPPGAAPLSMKIIPLGWSEGVKRFVVEQIQMAPSPMKVYHPNYAGNNTIDAEDPRSAGSNPLTRPTATLSPWERE